MTKMTSYREPNLDTIVQRVQEYFEASWLYSLSLLEIKNKTYENYIKPSKEEFEKVEQEITAIWHLDSVRNDKKIEEVIQQLIPLYNKFELKFQLDKRFYEAICEVRSKETDLTDLQKTHLDKEIKNYELGGINLPKEKKEELSKVEEELSLLSTEFGTNVIEANKEFTYPLLKEDVEKLPEIERKKLLNEDMTYSVDTPNDYMNFMKYSPNRKIREELYRMYVTRAPKNESIVDKTLLLRDKKREILGFDSYAELILEKRNASSVEEILEVFEYLTTNARPKAMKEIEELREYARRDGVEELKIYDLSYYSDKYRKEFYDVDQNEYKPYFEINSVLSGLFGFIEEYSGVKFIKNEDSSLDKWNEEVLIYDLEEDGELIGRVYYDLFERENKGSGAWKSTVTLRHEDQNLDIVLPVCNVVCNFENRNEEGLSLLSHSDVLTFFHEMGHAIHHLFSKVNVSSLSGTSVDWDVVEFPSQFLEYFAYDKSILQRFAKHHKTGEVLPDKMIEKLQRAKNYLSAYVTMKHSEIALFDISLHKGGVPNVLEVLSEVRSENSVLDVPEYERFHYTFGHVFSGGYAAGFYSYQWAEILSAGAYYKIQESKNPIDKFKEYKKLILEVGGSKNMISQYEKLTGETPNPLNLLKMDGIVD